jgi:hypothetical protein
MAKYTIITGIKPDGRTAIRDGKDMTVKEAVEIAKELREQGYTVITSKTGFPIYCPVCKVLVDVDRDLKGIQKYCKVCEINTWNQIYYDNSQLKLIDALESIKDITLRIEKLEEVHHD